MAYDVKKEERFACKLVEVARTGKTITYGELCDAVGLQGYCQALRYYLAKIGQKCRDHNLPLLSAIVINKKSRTPGNGIYDEFGNMMITEEQAEVFTHTDWTSLLETY